MLAENKGVIRNLVVKNRSRILYHYHALKPLLIIEKFVGIYRFYLKNGQLCSPNWLMKFYSAVIAVMTLCLFVLLVKLYAVIHGNDSLVDIIDGTPTFALLLYYGSTTIATSFFLSKSNMEVIIGFAELDKQLIINNIDDFYKKELKRNTVYLALLCVTQLILILILLVVGVNIMVAIDFPINLIQKIEIIIFCIFIGMVRSRLSVINSYVAKFLAEKDSKTVYTINRTTPLERVNVLAHPETNMEIRDLALLYDKLGNTCSLINEIFNLQIIMNLVSTFIDVVIIMWSSLYYFKTSISDSSPLVTASIWCSVKVFMLALVCVFCGRLRLVRNKTKSLVNEVIMDYGLPKTVRVQAKAFMELVEAWPLQIFVYDMFSVDITLMLKFISVATTYLIVIIQVFNFVD